ncbi:hypothetical protein EG327_009368 [Venturia inaequalis]|uniref:Uncharacterized protein n=1 Tax=Venturia inaequalis TaxID=5025 RepID=A0A8H3UP30_VENIN|nr:hypothetical protein EG327_009368 [Venturia inaequalis]
MSSSLNTAAFDARIHDPLSGTDAYCDRKMQDIDDEFSGYNMYSDLATWEYVAWKNVRLDAIQDKRMTAANIDEYHHVETLKVEPGTNYLVGLGYTSPSPFSRQANTVAYIARKKENLQGKCGENLRGTLEDLDRAWDAVSGKFQGIAQASEGDLDEHWLIELRKLRPNLVQYNPRPRAQRMAMAPTNTVGSSSSTGKRCRDNWAESEEAGGLSQPRAKKPRKTVSPATQNTRSSSRFKSTARTRARDDQAEEEANGEQSDCTSTKPEKGNKQGTVSRNKKTARQLAWMNMHFCVRNTETNKPSNWKVAMSLEFKKEYEYPLPHKADYSMKNYWQQMEASGHFEAGLVCDEQFYEDEGNYPGKDGSKNHPRIQKPAKKKQ